jgi:hypothetical protein
MAGEAVLGEHGTNPHFEELAAVFRNCCEWNYQENCGQT